jgi:hypothetical protein
MVGDIWLSYVDNGLHELRMIMPKEATQFKPQPNSLAEIALSARVEKPIDALVRALPNRSEWLRRVITEAAQRELIGNKGGDE